MTNTPTPPPEHKPTPVGPPVRWVTISRSYDEHGNLLTERTVDTTDTDPPPPDEPIPGYYL